MEISTPICDFVAGYAASGIARFHMPGHKGHGPLGCEALDITEVRGADALYMADGIIGESERNAAVLFGTAATVYSAEGSSLCIRAMLQLALTYRLPGCSRMIVAARNVHQSFVSAAALLDFPVSWLWPAAGQDNALCSCRITPEDLTRVLSGLPCPPAAVYITSPDYLGGLAPVRDLAEVCHRFGTRLLVDQAHGAYLRFLTPSLHAMDQGADLCCDSAHKTLPVLTGGAYLHLSHALPEAMRCAVKQTMLLFGSTSPSYLILQSLDRCNRALAEYLPEELARTAAQLDDIREQLLFQGWDVCTSDPLRITVRTPDALTGYELAEQLRAQGAECEYADPDYLVLMLTPYNSNEELQRIPALLGQNTLPPATGCLSLPRCRQMVSIREAMFSPNRISLPPREAVGRVCAGAAVACPPCIPIAVAGELLSADAAALMEHVGITQVEVLS